MNRSPKEPPKEQITATVADLDAALERYDWSPCTCLVALALRRHFEAEVINVDHLSALLQKDGITLVYDLFGVTRLMRKFDRAFPPNSDWDERQMIILRESLPVIFQASLSQQFDEDPPEAWETTQPEAADEKQDQPQ